MIPVLSRTLAVALLAVIVAVVWLIVFQPLWSTVADDRRALGQAALRIANQTEIQKRAGEYADALQRIPAESVDQVVYVQKTLSAAEATLQHDVTAIVSTSGMALISTQGLPSRPAGPFKKIGLRIEVTGTTDQLAGLFVGLNRSTKLLELSKATIRRRTEETTNLPAQLAVTLEIQGLIRG